MHRASLVKCFGKLTPMKGAFDINWTQKYEFSQLLDPFNFLGAVYTGGFIGATSDNSFKM
jgi:hypothetical protein